MNPLRLLAETATCLRFFSRLPLPGGADAPPLAPSLRMLPVAGLVIALPQAAVLALADRAGLPAAAAALLALASSALLTGGLHEDGLADTADGLGGGATPERRLAIMRDSRIGTYGTLALTLALALRATALAGLLARGGALGAGAALLGGAALSRALALLPMASLPPARRDGLGHGVGRPPGPALAVCSALGAVLGLALPPLGGGAGLGPALLGTLLAIAGAGGVTRLAFRGLGGHTGDVAGACQQVAEAAYLLGLLARLGPS